MSKSGTTKQPASKRSSAGGGNASRAQKTDKFNIAALGNIAKSPLKLRDWLDHNIPWLIGPRITSFEPRTGQRDSIVTIRGTNFAAKLTDNEVTIAATPTLVLAASSTELKVLVGRDTDSGPVKVKIGARSANGPYDFIVKSFSAGVGEDGPPVFAMGEGSGEPGDVNAIGTVRVCIVIAQTKDLVPSNPSAVRTTVDNRWSNVQTYYDQVSYSQTDVQYDIAGGIAKLDGNFTDFVDLNEPVENIIGSEQDRIAAICAQHAVDQGLKLNDYQMLCCVVYTKGGFVRAWGNRDLATFTYDNGKPVGDPDRVSISLTASHSINMLWINEDSDWGRFAHEFGHNIVSAPTTSGDGTATLAEDVYDSDLVDGGAATAQFFELMGAHDTHPSFTGYHLEKLGYYKAENIKVLSWNRNPFSEEFVIAAHALAEDTVDKRFHIVKIKVSEALSYYIEVRQRPGTTTQIFDGQIPIGAAPNQGGVIVTRVIADEMHNNQQTRFITLMHDEQVQLTGDTIEDPLRALKITVVNDAVQTRPLVCKVRIEWAQTIADDPNGAFDLKVEPWDSNYQTPDIWVDRDPIGTFDNAKDAQGRPTGPGDKPWVNHVNQFTARVHVSGAMGASDVKVTFYAVSPPGVGDNGNWAPIAVNTVASIAQDSFIDTFCNWVPVVGKHTCLRVHASQQLGEISGGNNGAQENIFDFQAAGSSPAAPLFIRTAVRNPLDERSPVSLTLAGVPSGWAAHIPHAWVWLDGKAEKEIDVAVIPLFDVNAYKFGKNKEGRLPGTAPIRVAGHVGRVYNVAPDAKGHNPGSRFYPIGGTYYRVSARKKGTIRIEANANGKNTVVVYGNTSPAFFEQRILVELTFPDGRTHRTEAVNTKTNGTFEARVSLLDDTRMVVSGTYQIQAFILNADTLADTESNVVYVTR